MRKKTAFLRAAALSVLTVAAAAGQTQDNSGDGLLKGSFRFRHLAVLNVDGNRDPAEVAASSGTIIFDGAGNYTATAIKVDNTIAGGAPQPLNVAGTYAIGSNGLGYIANPLNPNDYNLYIWGAVAQGVYAGSSTESQLEGVVANDTFIAIPAGTSPPTNAGFTSPYQTGLLDFTEPGGAGPAAIKNAAFELSPDGNGNLGVIAAHGQAANQSGTSLAQSITGAIYNFNSDGSATLTIPPPSGVSSADALFTGAKTIFQSADGNFILGWTAGAYDIFFGVKALTIPGATSVSAGLYFTAALEDSPGGNGGTDSYYGGTNNSGDSAGDGAVHERLNSPARLSYDRGTDNKMVLNADGTTGLDPFTGYEYTFGDGGLAFFAIGANGRFSLVVGLHAPSFSGAGVYLNPIGVVNAASYQPVTASLAPGELITLFGTGFSSVEMSMQGGQAFPPALGGVSVTINGMACPVYYISATQISVIVPYEVASNRTGLANIQVNSGAVSSNVVQMYLTDASPGSFSQNQNGLGYAAALHAATGQEITTSNPASPGEYISLFLTGLGTVAPPVSDGALGPSDPLSWSDVYNAGYGTGVFAVYFNDYTTGSLKNPGKIQFAGLAPGLAGLYQINVQLPASGLGSGDNVYIEFVTDAADVRQIQIPVGSS